MQRNENKNNSTKTIYGTLDLSLNPETNDKTIGEHAFSALGSFGTFLGQTTYKAGAFIGDTLYKAGTFIAAASGDHEKALDFVAAMEANVKQPSDEETKEPADYSSCKDNTRSQRI